MCRCKGFPAPLTDLTGAITFERENIASENLMGTLLGGPVSIDLQPAPESMPGYRIIATANGTAKADAVAGELNLPLQDELSGATDYEARVLFARGQEENQQPFRVELATDLQGMEIALPEPLRKAADDTIAVRGELRMESESDEIYTVGVCG